MPEFSRRALLSLLGAGCISLASLRARSDSNAGRARLHLTENPSGPSSAARAAIIAAAERAATYPQSGGALIEQIARHDGVTAAHVVLSNGSREALCHLTASLGRGGQILAAQPTYPTALSYAEQQGVSMRYVALTEDHQIDLDGMLDSIGSGVRLVYICNPNNPTGLLLDSDQLRLFCIAAARKVPVIVDEAFIELTPDPERGSMVELVRQGHDVIVTRTFSKVYGLAGLRIGYALAPPSRAAALRSAFATLPNEPALAAACACLGDKIYLDAARTYLRECRSRIYRICEENQLSYLRSEATFVYVDAGEPATAIQQRLATERVDVRVFDGERYRNWVRIGTGTPAELEMLATALPRVRGISSPEYGRERPRGDAELVRELRLRARTGNPP